MSEEKKRTIICVDDEPDVVGALYDTFMDDYNVKTATSGEEALKIFNEEDISLVISDQRMPEMEGTELLSKINEIKPICKKILLTGYADINAAIDAINSGAVDKYFSKPWEDDELLQAVKDLVEELSTDEFFENAIKDAKNMKQKVDEAKKGSEHFEKFMNSYLTGVCIVGNNDQIEFMNKAGLSIIKCKNIDEIQGKDYKDFFSINEMNKKQSLEKYMKKNISPDKIETKLCDGTSAGVQANVVFRSGESGLEIVGIAFNK